MLPPRIQMKVIKLFAGTFTVEKGVMWEHGFQFFLF
jgi:hypothetical protein